MHPTPDSSRIDSLFARMLVRYGHAFLRRWDGLQLADVKDDWARVLEHVPDDMVDFALDNLPEQPPIATQFRDLCARRPAPEVPQLPSPSASPAFVQQVLSGVSRGSSGDPKGWARKLRWREQRGERLTLAQRDAWRTALGTEIRTEEGQQCT
jgi:hypothetical protein